MTRRYVLLIDIMSWVDGDQVGETFKVLGATSGEKAVSKATQVLKKMNDPSRGPLVSSYKFRALLSVDRKLGL